LKVIQNDKGKCTITIYSAKGKDLIAKDSNGKSDPFFVFSQSQTGGVKKLFKTKVQKKTLNPSWDYSDKPVHFEAMFGGSINIQLYDYDLFGKNDDMGMILFRIPELYALQQVSGKDALEVTFYVGDKKGWVTIKMYIKK